VTSAGLPLGSPVPSLQKSWPWGSERAVGVQFSTSSPERCSTKLYLCAGREGFRTGSCPSQSLTMLPSEHAAQHLFFLLPAFGGRPEMTQTGAMLSGDPPHQSLYVEQII